ncbi:hypothetical protein ONE63_001628 [Megalurothrips usitatus]|uniref:JmjC domain-containing protein n=1 Tax=Megalurothrips usitatus TaxID=439358 RepID=A0AAV7X8Z1_9NEOP|nr:hypothetical protein ONE63_001628 [Megalurothrips usitatus]
MASVFTVSEEDLFEFDSFCDSKYSDINCQKYGFFKVKLDAHCAGQCTTIEEFLEHFGLAAQRNVRKAVLLSNVKDKSLFGFQNVTPSPFEKDAFVSTSCNPESFQDPVSSTNCCMKVLQTEGQEAFLKHFFDVVTSNPKVKQSKVRDDIRTIKKRAVAKKAEFLKKQSYKSCPTPEGKKRCLEMAIANETILESSPFEDGCLCDTCDVAYCHKKQKISEDCSEVKSCDLLYSSGIEESQNNYIHLSNNFSMTHLCFKNMLSDLGGMYPGVSYPFLYLGGTHSVFPLHVEDLSFWSFNFLLDGLPKFWIIIPPTSVGRLTDALHRKGFFYNHRWCRNNLGHKFYILTPQFLQEEGIPYEMVIQEKGEGIVLLPNAAHSGGNFGPNLAEACNFGSKNWIPYGCVSLNCSCMNDTVHTDLSDLVAVHAPELLQAYINNTIREVVDDQYFQKSIVVRKRDSEAYDPVTKHSSSRRKKALPSSVNPARVKCPVCDVSWASVKKTNIMTHLNKYHVHRMKDDVVIKFLEMLAGLRGEHR